MPKDIFMVLMSESQVHKERRGTLWAAGTACTETEGGGRSSLLKGTEEAV